MPRAVLDPGSRVLHAMLVSSAFLDAIHLVRDAAARHRFRIALHLPALDHALLGEYFGLFDRRDVLAQLLDDARGRRG